MHKDHKFPAKHTQMYKTTFLYNIATNMIALSAEYYKFEDASKHESCSVNIDIKKYNMK